MAVDDTIMAQRISHYHVEIRHPGQQDWTHIHNPKWETTPRELAARLYARLVERDHPGSKAQIVQTQKLEILTLATGKRNTLDLGRTILPR
ncbi:hypothetical protein QQG74_09525 [Micromonospora sp. FIMYZ51]|uniref:hypothetical protein n=1 Tax=Micromonospora sp. FIMYZ51 TaxID=3051832 RepID=UPI00311EFB11